MFTKTQNDNKDPCIQMPFIKLKKSNNYHRNSVCSYEPQELEYYPWNPPKLNGINFNHMFMGIFNTLNTNYNLILKLHRKKKPVFFLHALTNVYSSSFNIMLETLIHRVFVLVMLDHVGSNLTFTVNMLQIIS